MKAVLVLDKMPGGCVECPLARTVYGEMMCVATEKETNYIIGVDKPGSCPLRPMPEKIAETLYDGSFMDGVDCGWNECIDAIEGSKEE